MNARTQILMRAATDRLRPLGHELLGEGWRPEVVVFAPGEPGDLARIPGYKVALVVPLDSIPDEHGEDASAADSDTGGEQA